MSRNSGLKSYVLAMIQTK